MSHRIFAFTGGFDQSGETKNWLAMASAFRLSSASSCGRKLPATLLRLASSSFIRYLNANGQTRLWCSPEQTPARRKWFTERGLRHRCAKQMRSGDRLLRYESDIVGHRSLVIPTVLWSRRGYEGLYRSTIDSWIRWTQKHHSAWPTHADCIADWSIWSNHLDNRV